MGVLRAMRPSEGLYRNVQYRRDQQDTIRPRMVRARAILHCPTSVSSFLLFSTLVSSLSFGTHVHGTVHSASANFACSLSISFYPPLQCVAIITRPDRSPFTQHTTPCPEYHPFPPTPPLETEHRVSQEVAALEDCCDHSCKSHHFHTTSFHISLKTLSFSLSCLVSLTLRQNQRPQVAGFMCTDGSPDGKTTYPLKLSMYDLLHSAPPPPVVVVLEAHTTNAFRIRMGRSCVRIYLIGVKHQPGRIAPAKEHTNLQSADEHLTVHPIPEARWRLPTSLKGKRQASNADRPRLKAKRKAREGGM